MIPYMRANLADEAHGSRARRMRSIAVSRPDRADLSARAPELRDTRMEIIPKPGQRGSACAP